MAAVGRGVDPTREERIKKCENVIDLLFEYNNCNGFRKALTRSGEVKEIATDLHAVLQKFLLAIKAEKPENEEMM